MAAKKSPPSGALVLVGCLILYPLRAPTSWRAWPLLLRPTPASRECSQSRMRLRLRSMPPCIIRVYMPTKAHATWLATFSAASLVVRQSGGVAGAITWLCEPRDREACRLECGGRGARGGRAEAVGADKGLGRCCRGGPVAIAFARRAAGPQSGASDGAIPVGARNIF